MFHKPEITRSVGYVSVGLVLQTAEYSSPIKIKPITLPLAGIVNSEFHGSDLGICS